ncbi:uncharacterized protein LOC134466449 [Engraulis encrasicolus]|uniref:uncharacterized protein LOC134466449 n=1 Tax=Engraulis encrasicolus TaxID=184585 RepID=UPI002FCFF423
MIGEKDTYYFSNITYKLNFEDPAPSPPLSSPSAPPLPECERAGQCWMLLAILCPVSALLAALISSACFYCCKTGPDQGQGDGFQVSPLLSKNYPRSLDQDLLTEVIYKQL